MKKLVIIFLVWRVALFGMGLIAPLFLPYRQDFGYTSYSYYLENPLIGWQTSIEPWANFDGVHYLHIAQRGYIDEWRFFPLLPLLIHIVSFGNPNTVLVLGFLLTQLIAFFALYWLYRLLQLDFSEKTAFKTIICLLLFPMSFFLGSIYTEGLFLLLSATALYAARKKRWGVAVLLAALASATRIMGVVLVPTLLIELWLQHQTTLKKFIIEKWQMILMLSGGVLGLAVYSFFVHQQTGDSLLFLKAHTFLGNSRSAGLVFPLQTCFRYLKILLTLSPWLYEWWVALLESGTYLIASLFLLWGWFQPIRKSYWWFAFIGYIIPSLSGTFTGLPRYMLILFPLFLPLAMAKPKWILVTYLLAAIPWLLIFTALFTRGYFIS
jgi:hypothetical protein